MASKRKKSKVADKVTDKEKRDYLRSYARGFFTAQRLRRMGIGPSAFAALQKRRGD